MMMLKKIISFVTIILVTLSLSIVPCFALSSGKPVLYPPTLPYYVNSIAVDTYSSPAFYAVNDGRAGRTTNVDGDWFVSSDVTTIQNQPPDLLGMNITGQKFSVAYDSVIRSDILVTIDVAPYTFRYDSDVTMMPYFEYDLLNCSLSNDPEAYVNYSAYDPVTGEVSHGTFDVVLLPLDSHYGDNRSLYLELGYHVNAGDIVTLDTDLTFQISQDTSSNDLMVIGTTTHKGYVDFYDSPIIGVESTVDFNIVDFIGDTIDSFLDVTIFGEVTMGNLLLLVIAIPALLAVLRLLGGVG